MILYRLTKTKYLMTAWTGYGAKEAGGRWNSVGVPMVYVSETASLTMLETLVHLNAPQIMDSFTLLRIEVSDDQFQDADMAQLPANWSDEDAPPALAEYGDAWCYTNSSIALRVPSALSPVEYNFLLNPEHADFYGIARKADAIPFRFDNRLRPDRR